jgi:hypothetical protein
MKKLGFMFAVVLMFLFSCSTDDMLRTEPQQFPVDGNNQLEMARPSGNRTIKIAFTGASVNGDFVTNCLPRNRKLLKNGRFSGYLKGFGAINTNSSPYEITGCSVAPDDVPNGNEEWMYVLVAEGHITIGASDRLDFTINTKLYPWLYDTGRDEGDFIGKATINSGTGKFNGATGILDVYNGGMSGYGVDFSTGETTMRLSGTISVPN